MARERMIFERRSAMGSSGLRWRSIAFLSLLILCASLCLQRTEGESGYFTRSLYLYTSEKIAEDDGSFDQLVHLRHAFIVVYIILLPSPSISSLGTVYTLDHHHHLLPTAHTTIKDLLYHPSQKIPHFEYPSTSHPYPTRPSTST